MTTARQRLAKPLENAGTDACAVRARSLIKNAAVATTQEVARTWFRSAPFCQNSAEKPGDAMFGRRTTAGDKLDDRTARKIIAAAGLPEAGTCPECNGDGDIWEDEKTSWPQTSGRAAGPPAGWNGLGTVSKTRSPRVRTLRNARHMAGFAMGMNEKAAAKHLAATINGPANWAPSMVNGRTELARKCTGADAAFD